MRRPAGLLEAVAEADRRELSASTQIELAIQECKSRIDDDFNHKLYLHKESTNHNKSVDDLRIQLTNLLVTALTGARAIQNEFDSDVMFQAHRVNYDIIEMLKMTARLKRLSLRMMTACRVRQGHRCLSLPGGHHPLGRNP